jgi:alkylhydroperoxidase/carboxymuconolactone decarboxylase family protein YurZ
MDMLGGVDKEDNRQPVSIDELREMARAAISGLEPGLGLTGLERSLICFGLAAAPTALDIDGMGRHAREATGHGATPDQLMCVLLLVSALGVHTLHEGIRELIPVVNSTDETALSTPLTPTQAALKHKYEGDSSYWVRLDRQIPGFLDGLLRLSPSAYQGFFEFCALAWATDVLDARTKELVYLAIDASPTHRYGPGFRLHLDNSIRTGASPRQIEEALDLGGNGPSHEGVRW